MQSQERGQGQRHMDLLVTPPIPQAARDLLADASRGLGRAIRSTETGAASITGV